MIMIIYMNIIDQLIVITEMVVGEAVVVIKKLIQLQPKEHKDLIVHVAKLVDTVTVSGTH